jgi:hypothetical protein
MSATDVDHLDRDPPVWTQPSLVVGISPSRTGRCRTTPPMSTDRMSLVPTGSADLTLPRAAAGRI